MIWQDGAVEAKGVGNCKEDRVIHGAKSSERARKDPKVSGFSKSKNH